MNITEDRFGNENKNIINPQEIYEQIKSGKMSLGEFEKIWTK